MTKKDKQVYGGIVAVVLLIIIIWVFKGKPVTPPIQEGVNQSPSTSGQQSQSSPAPAMGSVWNGVLKNSDNPAKGNFMLVTSNRTIYIKTSRDFGSLVDKKVNVTYTGDSGSFTLGNITAAQ